jgi:N-acyl-D-amino-acid deacylase
MADLLIRGGTVIDGTGAAGRMSDVRVRDGLIAEVGPALASDGQRELDAGGAVVTPGFIDTHTHLDASLLWDPCADPMPQHGVTTIVAGNCSLSLAPVRPEQRDGMSAVFCYIEDMPEESFAEGIPWTWETHTEYSKALGGAGGLGVHAGLLVGHTALRWYVLGDEAWERPATPDERRQMASVLDSALASGGCGLSTSFFDHDPDGRPVPSMFADDAEFAALLDVVGAHQAVLGFIPQLNGDDPQGQVARVARLCQASDVTAVWNGLAVTYKYPDLVPRFLEHAAGLQASGHRIYPQVSPRTIDFRINWDRSMSFMMLPLGWARAIQARGDDKRRLLQDPAWRTTAREEWDAVKGRSIFPTNKPDKVRFVSVTRPDNQRWLGHSLADLAAERGGHLSDVLADWVVENDLEPGVVAIGMGNADVDAVADMLRHPAAMIGASDAGAHLGMLCATGDTTLLLTRHVRDRGDFTLEDAVWQLTGRQAQVFGFRDRGVITPGAAADLTVFALDELAWLPDEFVPDLPGGASRLRRPEGGYRYTVAAGVVTQEGGRLTGARPASVLRRRV